MKTKPPVLPTAFVNPNLHILEARYANLNHTWAAQNVCSPYARIYVIQSGGGVLTTAHKTIMLRPGYAYLIPTQMHFGYACPHSLQKLYFHVNLLGDDGLDILKQIEDIHETKLTKDIDKQIAAIHTGHGLASGLKLHSLAAGLLADLLNDAEELWHRPQYSAVVTAAVQMVQNNITMQLKTADLAGALFLSESTLHKHFKAEIGMTPGQYIDEVVFFHAALMLSQTDNSVKAISDSLGFCDQFYFARRFKEKTGFTPTAYRRNMQFNKEL